MDKQLVIVVGSGVIGLTVANMLLDSGKYSVTIVAENIPEPSLAGAMRSSSWASPWAGAHWRAWAEPNDSFLQAMEMETYFEMMKLAEAAPESGISKAQGVDLFETAGSKPWYANLVIDSRDLSVSELPIGVDHGIEYLTLLVNVPKYLVYLKDKFVSTGGKLVHARLAHILDALPYASAADCVLRDPIIINCTGIGSRNIGGVLDSTMHPIRGQTALVKAPNAKKTITRLGNQFCYIIPRGDGTVILGGTKGFDDWNASPDKSTTQIILQRTLALEPLLLNDDSGFLAAASDKERIEALSKQIISENVGFRPMREEGVRLELQQYVSEPSQKPTTIIHCYGHAGYGYQSSIGFANQVIKVIGSVGIDTRS